MKCIIPSGSQSVSAPFGEAVPKPNQFQGRSNWPCRGGDHQPVKGRGGRLRVGLACDHVFAFGKLHSGNI